MAGRSGIVGLFAIRVSSQLATVLVIIVVVLIYLRHGSHRVPDEGTPLPSVWLGGGLLCSGYAALHDSMA